MLVFPRNSKPPSHPTPSAPTGEIRAMQLHMYCMYSINTYKVLYIEYACESELHCKLKNFFKGMESKTLDLHWPVVIPSHLNALFNKSELCMTLHDISVCDVV